MRTRKKKDLVLALLILVSGSLSAQSEAGPQGATFENKSYDSLGVSVDVPSGWSSFPGENGDAKLLKIIEESKDTNGLEFHGLTVIIRPLKGKNLQDLVEDQKKTLSKIGKILAEAQDTMGGRTIHAFSFVSIGNALLSFIVITTNEENDTSCQYAFSCQAKDFQKYFSAYGQQMIYSFVYK